MTTSPRLWMRAGCIGLALWSCLTPGLAASAPAAPAVEEARSDAAAAKARLRELERNFELVVEEYNLVAERYENAQGRRALAGLRIRDLERRLDQTRAAAIAAARHLYKTSSSAELEAMLTARSLGDLQRRLDYLTASQTKRFEAVVSLRLARAARDRGRQSRPLCGGGGEESGAPR